MEIHDVLADEVIHLGVAAGPPVLVELEVVAPLAQVHEARHVAHRGVEPDIKVLVVGPRNAEAEVGRVARDVPVLQSGVEPLFELGDDILVQRRVLHPLAELFAVSTQPEEIMLRLPAHRRRAGYHRDRVDQVGRRIGLAAVFAGVAILVLGFTVRTGAANEPVGQKHALLLVIGLLDGFRINVTGLAEPGEHLDDERLVFRGVRRVIVVELNPEIAKVIGKLGRVPFRERFRRYSELARFQHDRRSMSIRRTDVDTVVAAELLKAHPDIGLQVFDQVPHMRRTVYIGQGAGDQ